MAIRFMSQSLAEIEPELRSHAAGLLHPIDSFLEDHIWSSHHYRIVVDDTPAGLVSIHGESLVTHFSLAPVFGHLGQVIFERVRRLESVTSAFVPTSDEMYLSHSIDTCREIRKQAYFFVLAAERVSVPPPEFTLRLATPGDVPVIRGGTGDFFGAVEDLIDQGQLHVTERGNQIAGFGVAVPGRLADATASIGMFTLERYRGEGIGTATITLLIQDCLRRQIRPTAGCWYYNHASKRTLERAGMYAPTRLLRIEY